MTNSEARKRETPGPIEVQIGVVEDKAGQPAVLIQFPQGWITTNAADARRVAGLLLDAADQIPQGEKSIEVQPCPECRVGKHINCDGGAWDYVADEPAPCPCSAAGHKDA